MYFSIPECILSYLKDFTKIERIFYEDKALVLFYYQQGVRTGIAHPYFHHSYPLKVITPLSLERGLGVRLLGVRLFGCRCSLPFRES